MKRSRSTPRRVAQIALLVANAALDRHDWRVARLAVEIHLARAMHGPIRKQHRELSALIDQLMILEEAA